MYWYICSIQTDPTRLYSSLCKGFKSSAKCFPSFSSTRGSSPSLVPLPSGTSRPFSLGVERSSIAILSTFLRSRLLPASRTNGRSNKPTETSINIIYGSPKQPNNVVTVQFWSYSGFKTNGSIAEVTALDLSKTRQLGRPRSPANRFRN